MGKTAGWKRIFRPPCILLALTLLWTLFIFSNSLQTGAQSDQRSGQVVELVGGALGNAGMDLHSIILLVRKSAHFIEFALLGAGMLLTLHAFRRPLRRGLPALLFLGLLVPLMDESIQLVSPGRSAQLADVWLDFGGVLFGLLAAGGILALRSRRIRRKREKAPADGRFPNR